MAALLFLRRAASLSSGIGTRRAEGPYSAFTPKGYKFRLSRQAAQLSFKPLAMNGQTRRSSSRLTKGMESCT